MFNGISELKKLTIIFPGGQLATVLIQKERDTKLENLINRLCSLRGYNLSKAKKVRIVDDTDEKVDLSKTVGESGLTFIEIADKTSDKEAKKQKDLEEYKSRPRPPGINLIPGNNCYIPLEDQLYDDEKKALQEAKKWEVSKYFSDEFIMSVLFSRKFDMKRSEEFLTSSLNWRKERGYLKIPRFETLDKGMFDLGIYYTGTRDSEGRSIRYLRFQKSTPNQNGQTVENFLNYTVWYAYVGIFHEGIDGLRNGICIVADAEGFSWKQFDIDFHKRTHDLWLGRFPLLMRRMLVINPPRDRKSVV